MSRIVAAHTDLSPRDRLVVAAADSFYLYGVRAVGIDRLIREADVAKATFYDHFRSKNDLVVAYLEAWDRGWLSWFRQSVQARAVVAVDQIFAMFDVLADLFADGEFRGCAFARAITDIGADDERVGEISRRHKAALETHIAAVAADSGLTDPEVLARQLVLLIEGAVVTAARERTTEAAHLAQAIARTLVRSHLIPGS